MACEWKTLPLEDCMSAIIDYRGKTPEKTTSGIPLITAKVIKGGRIERPDEFISETDYSAWMRRGMPNPGDIVMTTEAPLGEVAQLDGRKVALAQRVITLRGKPGLLDNTFLKFLLQSSPIQAQLCSRSTGTTVVGIRQSELRKVRLTLPSFAEQRAIAGVLGALDDKIESNRRTSQALERVARAIFRAWFVDFEPVKAKAAGARSFPGMPQEAFDSLPTKFVGSELGPVPEGWVAGALGDQCEINALSVRKGEIKGDIEYIDISSVTMGRLDSVQFVPFTDAPSRARRRIRHGDTIWSCVRPNHRSYLFIHTPPENRIVSTGFVVLSPGIFGPSLLHQVTIQPEFVDYLVSNADGSAYPAVRADHFAVAQVIVAPTSIREAFEATTMPFLDHIACSERTCCRLATMRDYLLPKLLSGEVRVVADSVCSILEPTAAVRERRPGHE